MPLFLEFRITYLRNKEGDMKKHPDWALKQKRKGTELRLINGKYYLYEVSSRWNPEKRRAQKITGKLLGKITPEGFVTSPKYALSHPPERSIPVREYGASWFLERISGDILTALQSSFPSLWKEVFCMAMMRLLHKARLKNIQAKFYHSYLSVLYPQINLSDKRVSKVLRLVGEERPQITAFFKAMFPAHKKESSSGKKNYLLIDATHVLSYAQDMEIAHPGYNSQGEFSPQVHLLFIHAVSLKLPVYYRIVGGDIREVKAFRLTLEESGIQDAVLIGDKGFYSEKNVEWLEEESLHYILPLRRNSTLIDYTPMQQPGKRGFDGYFKYHDRYIWHYSRPQDKNRVVYCFLDEKLKCKEEEDYLKRIETHPVEYSMAGFHEEQFSCGSLALLTNVPGQGAQDTFHQYKGRNGIEQIIDTMKNTLQADSSYMRDTQTLEGWMFITFLGLQWYYRIYRLLSEKKLHSKFSPEDLLDHLAEIKKLRINDTWHISEFTSKTQKLLEKLGTPIT